MIRRAARRLPRPARDAIRRARSSYRSARYRVGARLRPLHLGAGEVEAALREAGLGEGDSVFLQAAMSPFGTFEEGAMTLIEGAAHAVGEEGLIAMPAFPHATLAVDHLATDPVFDVRRTPSRMGTVSEAFRRMPATLRSLHPTQSATAQGPGAAELLEGHEVAPTPFGRGTPFWRLVERDAHQIFFGTGVRVLSMYHTFECVHEPPFPLPTFAERRFEARCIDSAGREVTVTTMVPNPELAPIRIDANARLQRLFRQRFIDNAGARVVALGRGEILAIRLQAMFAEFERMLAAGITMYDTALPRAAAAADASSRAGG